MTYWSVLLIVMGVTIIIGLGVRSALVVYYGSKTSKEDQLIESIALLIMQWLAALLIWTGL